MSLFWSQWTTAFTPYRIKKLTGILRDARFPYAHLMARAKKVNKDTFHEYISKQFQGPDALALHTLLDWWAVSTGGLMAG